MISGWCGFSGDCIGDSIIDSIGFSIGAFNGDCDGDCNGDAGGVCEHVQDDICGDFGDTTCDINGNDGGRTSSIMGVGFNFFVKFVSIWFIFFFLSNGRYSIFLVICVGNWKGPWFESMKFQGNKFVDDTEFKTVLAASTD